MSGEEDQGERNEEASAKKLEDARRKGEGPKSQDLLTALSYAGAAAFLALAGPSAFLATGERLAGLLRLAGAGGVPSFAQVVGTAGPLAGLVAAPAALVVAGLAAQGTVVLAPGKLAPRASKVSPLAQAKQKFGPSGLFEFAKSAAKLGLLCGVLVIIGLRELDRIAGMPALPDRAAIAASFGPAAAMLGPVVALAAGVGAIDLIWQRFDHRRRNRMSRKEQTDEAKEAEGDPHLKSRRRARAEQIATTRMMADVPGADVVVMNPTHYAVALKWSRAPGSAPVCVAKGFDEVALRIRAAAEGAGVPVKVDPPLARGLHAAAEIGSEVPPETWRAVAALIRFADAMRRAR
ncbi:flagellar biosynthetic protein FlhB [Hasllibacter halocynthiae]|uniref:Flagellar biosynthetic protein FlhB n=1 Tax=Hasllibacter halocynthiae TaxID=595589 RepID=A0A2T0X2N5_9RHOB|nr:flagellar type III secretion system protein FlhB [Hasllibacter halocynthiae]PRY93206.1 flagellar biosynthetic protein FlhB [Hasllibacter halocynthiae]